MPKPRNAPRVFGVFAFARKVKTIHGTIVTPKGIDTPITTAEAATLCGVTVSTIRQWAHKGLIAPVDIVGRRKFYRVLDVAKAERATRTRARR